MEKRKQLNMQMDTDNEPFNPLKDMTLWMIFCLTLRQSIWKPAR